LISEVFCPLLFFKFFLEKIMGTHFDFWVFSEFRGEGGGGMKYSDLMYSFKVFDFLTSKN
jgi:hypothetical protein